MGSSPKAEIIAGLTTFLAMAYILVVNAGMFATLSVVSFDAMYVTTALSAIIGTVLMGLLSNLPLAQAHGWPYVRFFLRKRACIRSHRRSCVRYVDRYVTELDNF